MNRAIKGVAGFFFTDIFLPGLLLLQSLSASAYTCNKQIIEAETANRIDGASKIEDNSASGKYLVSLTKAGQALTFINLTAANKLATRYASTQVGIIAVSLNN